MSSHTNPLQPSRDLVQWGLSSDNAHVAHVFQMMAGTTRNSPITFRGLQSARSTDSILDLQFVRNPLDSLEVFEAEDASGRMCTCPVCRSKSLLALSEIAQTPDAEDEDGYVVPDVQIGATGIVMPGRNQLARWFKVPVVPKFSRSKYHQKATIEAKHHGIFTFFSSFSFQTVFFTPCPSTLLIAMAIAGVAAYRTFTLLKKVANKEDQGIKLEMTVRVHAYKARNSAWERLYYCSGCGMVHDREGRRSLPWYSMLQLVHYPEQEFEAIAAPSDTEVVNIESAITQAARVA